MSNEVVVCGRFLRAFKLWLPFCALNECSACFFEDGLLLDGRPFLKYKKSTDELSLVKVRVKSELTHGFDTRYYYGPQGWRKRGASCGIIRGKHGAAQRQEGKTRQG